MKGHTYYETHLMKSRGSGHMHDPPGKSSLKFERSKIISVAFLAILLTFISHTKK